MTSSPQLVVLDLETTGLYTKDRIVEIAIVELDEDWQPAGYWHTLTNPGRDVGPTDRHGVTASMCAGAPTFADVAPTVASLLEGRILVGHNVKGFDLRILRAEFERVGVGIDGVPLDTMWEATAAGLPRGLAAACDRAGVEPWEEHTALGDALATARLLVALADSVDRDRPRPVEVWGYDPSFSAVRTCVRPEGAGAGTAAGISRLAPCAHVHLTPEQLAYLALLDEALDDFVIDSAEAAALVVLAAELGLTPDQVDQLHRVWFDDLATAVLADGVVTETEAERLASAADHLGVGVALESDQGAAASLVDRSDLAGEVVVFTGAPAIRLRGSAWSRASATSAAEALGATVGKSVTKATTILVAADTETLSGKARLARERGVLVVPAEDFAALVERSA